MSTWTKKKIVQSVAIDKEVYKPLLQISRISGHSISKIVNNALKKKVETLKSAYPAYIHVDVDGFIEDRIRRQRGV